MKLTIRAATTATDMVAPSELAALETNAFIDGAVEDVCCKGIMEGNFDVEIGNFDGFTVGLAGIGFVEGETVGLRDGGFFVGFTVGPTVEGFMEGSSDGASEGESVGLSLGYILGSTVGSVEILGEEEGTMVGRIDG